MRDRHHRHVEAHSRGDSTAPPLDVSRAWRPPPDRTWRPHGADESRCCARADTGSQDLLCLQWDEKGPGHTRPQTLDWEGGG